MATRVCRVVRLASLGKRLSVFVSLAWRNSASVTVRTLQADAGSRRRMQMQYTGLRRRHARANVSGRRMVAYAVGLRCPADPHPSNPSNAACSSACTALTSLALCQSSLPPLDPQRPRSHHRNMFLSLPYRRQPLSPTFGHPTARAKCAISLQAVGIITKLTRGTASARRILSSPTSLRSS